MGDLDQSGRIPVAHPSPRACCTLIIVRWCRNGLVAGLLLGGCTSFVGAEQTGPTPKDTDTEQGTTGTTTGDEGTTGDAQGSGDGSGDVSTNTTNSSPSTSDSGATTDGSSGSTSGVEGFPFEATYTGSFTARCQVSILGSLDIAVDGAGNITGGATAFGRTAAVTGTVDALGGVNGTAAIIELGQCDLTGTIGEGNLIGNGSFNCPSVPCSGSWTLVGI